MTITKSARRVLCIVVVLTTSIVAIITLRVRKICMDQIVFAANELSQRPLTLENCADDQREAHSIESTESADIRKQLAAWMRGVPIGRADFTSYAPGTVVLSPDVKVNFISDIVVISIARSSASYAWHCSWRARPEDVSIRYAIRAEIARLSKTRSEREIEGVRTQ